MKSKTRYRLNFFLRNFTDLIFYPGGDSGFGVRVPSASEEPGVDEQQDEGKGDEREEDRTSVEVQIGRKLREIGDHLQQEHMQLVRETRL